MSIPLGSHTVLSIGSSENLVLDVYQDNVTYFMFFFILVTCFLDNVLA